MKRTAELKELFANGDYDNLLTDIYLDTSRIEYHKER